MIPCSNGHAEDLRLLGNALERTKTESFEMESRARRKIAHRPVSTSSGPAIRRNSSRGVSGGAERHASRAGLLDVGQTAAEFPPPRRPTRV
jgi:hypothetical protein